MKSPWPGQWLLARVDICKKKVGDTHKGIGEGSERHSERGTENVCVNPDVPIAIDLPMLTASSLRF